MTGLEQLQEGREAPEELRVRHQEEEESRPCCKYANGTKSK